MLDNIFQKFLFQTKFDFVRIFSHDFYLANLCQYLLSLIFFEREQIWKLPAVILSSAWCFSDPEFSKITRMKNQWEIFNLENPIAVNNQCQGLTNKNLSRFLLRTKFWFIFERKNKTFLIAHPMTRAACWKNGNMASLIGRSRW